MNRVSNSCRRVVWLIVVVSLLGQWGGATLQGQDYLDTKALKKEADKKGSSSQVKQQLAFAYLLSGDTAKAEGYLIKAVDEGDLDAAFRLARLYETKQLYPSDKKLGLTAEEAPLYYYKRAAEKIPWASYKAGELLYNRAEMKEAVPFLREAAQKDILEAFHLYGMCVAYHHAADPYEEAVYYFRVVEMLDSKNKRQATDELTRLKVRVPPDKYSRAIAQAEDYLRKSH